MHQGMSRWEVEFFACKCQHFFILQCADRSVETERWRLEMRASGMTTWSAPWRCAGTTRRAEAARPSTRGAKLLTKSGQSRDNPSTQLQGPTTNLLSTQPQGSFITLPLAALSSDWLVESVIAVENGGVRLGSRLDLMSKHVTNKRLQVSRSVIKDLADALGFRPTHTCLK